MTSPRVIIIVMMMTTTANAPDTDPSVADSGTEDADTKFTVLIVVVCLLQHITPALGLLPSQL